MKGKRARVEGSIDKREEGKEHICRRKEKRKKE